MSQKPARPAGWSPDRTVGIKSGLEHRFNTISPKKSLHSHQQCRQCRRSHGRRLSAQFAAVLGWAPCDLATRSSNLVRGEHPGELEGGCHEPACPISRTRLGSEAYPCRTETTRPE